MNKLKKYTLLFLFLAISHFSSGQRKASTKDIPNSTNTDTTLTLLTYGLPYFDRQNSENVISRKWGIRFYPVAGCTVTKHLVDSVKKNNKKVNKLIERKYGIGWRDKYEKEVDEEFEKEKIVAEILDKVDFIKMKDSLMGLEGNGLHYYMTPNKNPFEYNVSVEGWGNNDNKGIWFSYYRLTVNYETKKYTLVDDKIQGRQ